MKTNKFENTIRRKLESIEPDFQEQDWVRMQNYMQAHTPPSFWQQYSSWIGYAAAASVTMVMAFLYVNQLSQNDHLITDVKNLQSQIEVIKNQPAQIVKTDTIYLVQKETVPANEYATHDIQESTSRNDTQEQLATQDSRNLQQSLEKATDVTSDNVGERIANAPDESLSGSANIKNGTAHNDYGATGTSSSNDPANVESTDVVDFKGNRPSGSSNIAASSGQRVLSPESEMYTINNTVGMNSGSVLSRKMNYSLASRLSIRQIQKIITPVVPNTQIAKATVSDKKVEKTTQTENVIPKLPIKAPYRFGGGIQIENGGQAKSVVAEVLVAKKFSISAGISWLKVKPMEFFTEKMFREKNRKDFKQSHPGEVPLVFDIYNIKVNPTLVQIPLTVAFRNTLKDDWAYYAGAGTNIRVSSKENISYDCKAPNNMFFNQTFDRKTDIPVISSVNLTMGIEKVWHPIVVQAEGYLFTYFKPLTPLSHNAGPGVKVKLLYQIGGKKM